MAPCVMHIDEIEKTLAGAGAGHLDSRVTSRVVGSVLTWLPERGLGRAGAPAPVFVVAAANRVESLPPELSRPGRFDQVFFLDLPEPTERAAILDIHLHLQARTQTIPAEAIEALAGGPSGDSGPSTSWRTTRWSPSPPLDRLPALARVLLGREALPEETTASLAREATEIVSAWMSRWAVPLAHTVGVEHALAIDAGGRRVAWDAPDAFLRGRLDLVTVDVRQATVCDWKSGWATEDDEDLHHAWAPGCYAALLWAWAPRIEPVTVEYYYLRTGRVARASFAPVDAIETLAWARTIAARIADALARPEDPDGPAKSDAGTRNEIGCII